MIFHHIGDLHFSEKRLAQKVECADRIVRHVEAIKPDAVIVGGDVFDHPLRMQDPAALEAVRFFSRLAEISPILAIKGNHHHDQSSVEILPFVKGRYPIHLATEPSVFALHEGGRIRQHKFADVVLDAAGAFAELERAQAVFFGLPYPSQSFLAATARLSPEEMTAAVSEAIKGIVMGFGAVNLRPGIPKILIFHGTIAGAMYSDSQRELGLDIILAPVDVGHAGFDVTMAAHLHHCQRIETSTGPICYPGGLICSHWGESGAKGGWDHTITTQGGKVVVESKHFDVQAKPMIVVDVDLSDPFFEAPAAAAGAEDIQLRIKMTDADRERLAGMDWKQAFPSATNIDVLPDIEKVESIRCEEVRAAVTLRQKVEAWRTHQETIGEPVPGLTPAVLEKADMLESMNVEALIAATKGRLTRA